LDEAINLSSLRPTTTLNLYHVLYHPLSRRILSQYEDKVGCSNQGIFEFLISSKIVKPESYLYQKKINLMKLDYRGVPYSHTSYTTGYLASEEDRGVYWRWRTFYMHPFLQKQFVREEEEEVMRSILQEQVRNDDMTIGNWSTCSHDVSLWDGVRVMDGFVTKIDYLNNFLFSPTIIHHLSSLNHLNVLHIELKNGFDGEGVDLGLLTNLCDLLIMFRPPSSSSSTHFLSSLTSLSNSLRSLALYGEENSS